MLAADWYVLARRRYDVEAMYRADGPYRGVRWAAVAAWLLGFLVYNWINPGTVTAWVSLVERLFADLVGLPFPLSARLPWLGARSPRSPSPSWLCWPSVAAPGRRLPHDHHHVRGDAG